jgi:hypothetical protein
MQGEEMIKIRFKNNWENVYRIVFFHIGYDCITLQTTAMPEFDKWKFIFNFELCVLNFLLTVEIKAKNK